MKFSCLVLIVLLLCSAVAGANMLVNPGFETGAGWAKVGNIDRPSWAARSGDTGVVFQGWTPSPAGFSQEVAVASGTYTFTIWAFRETNYLALNTDLRIEWLNASGVSIQATTVSNYTSLPNDSMWHQIFVTGTCTSSDLARVRVSVNASWTPAGGACSFMVDDAELYDGSYSGSRLSNGGFENGKGSFRRMQWNGVPDLTGFGQTNGGYVGETWAWHSGTQGVAFYSFDSIAKSNWAVRMWQNVNPLGRTGVYTFALFLNYETNAWFSNAQMSIEWYDNTFSNKVQTDAVTNLTVLKDWNWHEYAIEATLTNPACYEARVVFSANWTFQPTNVAGDSGRSTKLDDVRFLPVPYSEFTNSMITDWCYHNSVGFNAQGEQVPGTNVGAFLQVSYSATTVTFYVLANSPSQAKYYPSEDNRWELRTSWWNPEVLNWTNNWANMTRMGDVTIPSGTPFHGQPTVGTKTASLWKLVWPMPRTSGGLLYTNHTLVYYAPFAKVTNGFMETSYQYLLSWNTQLTNNLGQQLGQTPEDHDYMFDLNPEVMPVFTNGGFEEPIPATNNLDYTHWTGIGGANRETWALHTGLWGARFPTWDPNRSILYQDVAVTGGMFVFSGWVQIQTGVSAAAASLSMQWFDKDGRMVQENKKDLMNVPRGSWWNRAVLLGACSQTNLDHVRVGIDAYYGDGQAAFNEAFMFDDAQFAAIPAYGLVNTGFESGADGNLVDWYGYTTYEHNWGGWPHSGTQFAAFQGWEETQPRYESFLSQPMMASTGQYTLSVWLKREADFALTNASLKIEWYDGTLTNKVQADTISQVTVANDTTWRIYTMTGTCANANLRAIVPGVLVQWDRNIGGASRTMGADDFSLAFTNAVSEYTDGIPNWWWDKYSIIDRVASGDEDGDNYNNDEEYIADSSPTDITSFYSNVTRVAGRSVMVLFVDPSSTARVYDVYWKTNLMMNDSWQKLNLNVQGVGGALSLTVTNDAPGKRFYRTGVQLP